MNMNQNDWIEAVLSSATSPKMAVSEEVLLDRIQQKIKAESISLRWRLSVAAAVLLLISINLLVVLHYKNNNNATDSMQLNTYFQQSNQLYSHV